MNRPLPDDTDIEGMGGISVEEALERSLLRRIPEVQQAIREQADREGRDIIDVFIDWMQECRADQEVGFAVRTKEMRRLPDSQNK